MKHDEYYGDQRMPWWCTRTTLAGSPCKGSQVRWGSPEMPNPHSCVSHLTPVEKDELQLITGRLAARTRAAEEALFVGVPACWSWAPPTTGDIARLKESYSPLDRALMPDGEWDAIMMSDWHQNRCAICGQTTALVQDHDLRTGLIRGYLCRSCSVCEASRRGGVWDKYRERSPAWICGL